MRFSFFRACPGDHRCELMGLLQLISFISEFRIQFSDNVLSRSNDYRLSYLCRAFFHSLPFLKVVHNYTLFHKKVPFLFFFIVFTLVMINLHELFTCCS